MDRKPSPTIKDLIFRLARDNPDKICYSNDVQKGGTNEGGKIGHYEYHGIIYGFYVNQKTGMPEEQAPCGQFPFWQYPVDDDFEHEYNKNWYFPNLTAE